MGYFGGFGEVEECLADGVLVVDFFLRQAVVGYVEESFLLGISLFACVVVNGLTDSVHCVLELVG